MCEADFVKWCRDRAIKFDGLELRSAGEGAGNGIFATEQFRRDQVMISLPESQLITAGLVAELEDYKQRIAGADPRLTPFDALTLFFYQEDHEKSEWAPYLRMLPKHFDTPAYQQKPIDPNLLPLSIRSFYTGQQEDIQTSFEKLKMALNSDVDYKRFIWAWHVVNTRCIYVENRPHPALDNSGGDTLAVIPFVDMLNHSPNAQGIAMYEKTSKSYTVRCALFVSEGDQVFVCYGPHDNSRLWMEYGFSLPDNPNTKVLLSHDLIIALAKKTGFPVTAVHEVAVKEASLPCNLYKSDEGPSWALLTTVRILMLTTSEIKRWKDVIYAEKERELKKRLESDSDSETEDELDRTVLKVRSTVSKILQELRLSFISKISQIPEDLRWMWDEQLQLIDLVITANDAVLKQKQFIE